MDAVRDQVTGDDAYTITAERAFPPPTLTSLQSLWDRWRQLNDDCRGDNIDSACTERDRIMRRHAYDSAALFLAAWRRRDLATLEQLTSTEAALPFLGGSIRGLLSFRPDETAFDMTYDVEETGTVAGWMRTTAGTDLYFSWGNDVTRGWLVDGVAPDVG